MISVINVEFLCHQIRQFQSVHYLGLWTKAVLCNIYFQHISTFYSLFVPATKHARHPWLFQRECVKDGLLQSPAFTRRFFIDVAAESFTLGMCLTALFSLSFRYFFV